MKRTILLHWRRLRDLQTITVYGVRIKCGADDLPRHVRSLLFKGSYERDECIMIQTHVKKDDIVLEIGAGLGLVSLVAAQAAHSGAVYSYEANPAMEPLIRGNYALNEMTPQLSMKAVTADGQPIAFYQDPNLLSSSAYDRKMDVPKITVESARISNLIEEHRPNVLIMDVEGSEQSLLPCADLTDVRAIMVELHPHIIGQDVVADLIKGLQTRGFKIRKQSHKTYLFTQDV